MSKWNKICHSFKKVRAIVNDDDTTTSHCIAIMYALEQCCDELTPNHDEEWEFYDAFRDLKSEIHEEVELMDDENSVDTVDSYLAEFYDLCDSARVWLTLQYD